MSQAAVRLLSRASLLALMLIAAGCSSNAPATVTGKVTFKNEPVITGTVTIVAGDKTAIGGISPDGTYTVMDAPTGKVKIAVSSPKPATGPNVPREVVRGRNRSDQTAQPQVDPNKWRALPDTVANPDTSGIETELKGGSQTYDINIPG